MILFFGPPGSGKSVQGQLLVSRNGWQWLSTGELFRASEDPDVHRLLSAGELIDDELTNKVLATALAKIHSGTRVVVDGYPRNTGQARWLDDHLPGIERHIACVVVFDVPREELIRRLSGRGRSEDKLEVIERRLDIYAEKTQPVIDYYKAEGVTIAAIDGSGEVADVHERIMETITAAIEPNTIPTVNEGA